MAIRVVLADDSLLALEGLTAMLARADGIEVVATAGSRGAARHEIDVHNPDVLVSDIRMPPTNVDEGITLAADMRDERPSLGIVILSAYAEPQFALRLFESGSEGRAYLLKDRMRSRNDLVNAIEAVARGDSVVDPKVVETLVDARRRQAESPLRELTPREIEVLAQIAEGCSNTAIAERLYLTKRAVEKNITWIFLKLGLSQADDAKDISPRVKAALLFLAGDELRADPPPD
jgi:DNA-binding NarL/FixJ family response regulator